LDGRGEELFDDQRERAAGGADRQGHTRREQRQHEGSAENERSSERRARAA
jgi:hypothetical protein